MKNIRRLLSSSNAFDPARWGRYAVTSVVANATIWLMLVMYVLLWPQSFKSEWSLILPGSDTDARVSLNDIGQAYGTSRSSYDSKSLDPRVNYNAIMTSDSVRDEAAKLAGLGPDSFDKPKIKLIDQSSVMEIRIYGKSALEAQNKSLALYEAFQKRLNALRADEAIQKDKGVEAAIRTTKVKLDNAQKKLIDYKVAAHIVSSKQLEEMALGNTVLAKKRLDLLAQLAHNKRYIESLSTGLSVSPEAASQTLTLQSDTLFIELFRQYSTATVALSDAQFKWGPNHPKVREANKTQETALASLLLRARSLLGNDNFTEKQLRSLNLVLSEQAREPLLRELVSMHVDTAAKQSELAELNHQRGQMEQELNGLAQKTSVLDDLERELKFAEAVFTSTLGKTDIGNANIFTSYPLVQMLEPPTLSRKPTSPNRMVALAGAIAASVFLNIGLTLAWLRKKKNGHQA